MTSEPARSSDDVEKHPMLRRVLSVTWKLAILVAVVAFVIYRTHFAPVVVEGALVEVGAIATEVMGTGTLEARVQATISPRISGLISEVFVDQGDRVKKGQALAALYDADLRQQLEMAKAELAATRAGVDRSGADIARAQANLKQARLSYDRMASLAQAQDVSTEELDKSIQQREVADAELRRAELVKIELERQVAKAEESLRYYEARLADTRITSPFDGLVIRRSREPGDIAVPGTEILQVISTDQMWVTAWVDETAMASLAVGQSARVVFRSEPEKTYSGTVSRMAPFADRETREFRVDVAVQQLPDPWALGQRAEVFIQTDFREQAVLAPASAISWRAGEPGVFVAESGKAAWRDITLGLRSRERVEVVKGLTVGEQVIWQGKSGQKPITEGRPVTAAQQP